MAAALCRPFGNLVCVLCRTGSVSFASTVCGLVLFVALMGVMYT